jgi:hypothetical protein
MIRKHLRNKLLMAFGLLVWLGAFQPANAADSQKKSGRDSAGGAALLLYGEQCAREIGPIPAFDCNQGTVVPITVNGATPAQYTQGMTCDRPAMLPYGSNTFGQCTPYSKIVDLSHDKIQISAFCRREFLRDQNSPLFDEVDIVLHSNANGKTCWFHAENPPGSSAGFDASRVPSPTEKAPPAGKVAAKDFWWAPAATASKNCGGCHDADPFMFSPWLGQVWHKVPTDPLGKYSHVGLAFKNWHSSAINTPNNTCTGCHRIGNQASCTDNIIASAAGAVHIAGGNALANSYPLSHWMPADNVESRAFWQTVHGQSVKDLLTCCGDPTNKICTITPITPVVGAKRH